MHNYKLIIEYDGRNFEGWQKQKHTHNTVQDCIETAIGKILKDEIKLIGAGRTDSGVSAENQVANFRCAAELDLKNFRYSLNSILPGTITIKKISSVSKNFHSRYSAKKREYLYRITTQKKSISRDYYYHMKSELDFNRIDEFIKFIRGLGQFRSFCKNKSDKRDFRCRVCEFSYTIRKSKNEIIFKIAADRFLHSMVRALIGCALDIGRGKLEFKHFKEKIKKGEKIHIHYLPANALFLNKIHY